MQGLNQDNVYLAVDGKTPELIKLKMATTANPNHIAPASKGVLAANNIKSKVALEKTPKKSFRQYPWSTKVAIVGIICLLLLAGVVAGLVVLFMKSESKTIESPSEGSKTMSPYPTCTVANAVKLVATECKTSNAVVSNYAGIGSGGKCTFKMGQLFHALQVFLMQLDGWQMVKGEQVDSAILKELRSMVVAIYL